MTIDYETQYRLMRAAATKVDGELLRRFTAVCQDNDWIKVGGAEFEPEGFCYEGDYPYYLERYEDRETLRQFFEHGNWSIRTAVQYADLIFVNQVNGGDEWWTLKVTDDELIPFESLSWRLIIKRGKFDEQLDRMLKATVDECRKLEY